MQFRTHAQKSLKFPNDLLEEVGKFSQLLLLFLGE
jgi:hypothetical protein